MLWVGNKYNKTLGLDEKKPSSSPGFRDMKINPFTLSFPPGLEEEFLADYFKYSVWQVRISLVLAIIIWASFGLLDLALVPEMKNVLWFIRFGIVCPGLILSLALTYSPGYKHYMQPAIFGSLVLGGAAITAMLIVVPVPVLASYYTGLILVFMFGYTLLRARFIWATCAGWIIVMLYEIAAVWINKTPLPILINNNFFFINGNIIGMIACYAIEFYTRRDFYMARLLQEEKEKVNLANQELEKRVRERTFQLNKTNEDLVQEMEERKRTEKKLIQAHKMEAIGRLAGGIAHDFNNILTAIMGYAEIGIYKKNIDREKIVFSFTQILQAGGRAKDLIKQILTFSRQREQERVPVKVSTIVRETLKLLSATISKTIEIREIVTTENDNILADPTQLHQIMMNLGTNAYHAMQQTGGVIEIELSSIACDGGTSYGISDMEPGPYVHLRVTDTGTGMDPSVMERIFDPFFTTKGPTQGSGMGLSVVHGIVESYGGRITVESRVGSGTTFHLFFPAIQKADTAEQQACHDMPAGSECILFVDDEPSLVEVGQEMLEEFGYAVCTSTDASEALAFFKKEPQRFDLVITDKNMPSMSGYDLAQEMLVIRPDIPIILCSGFNDAADIEKARSCGCKEILMKPLAMREMAATIRSVLDRTN